MKKVISILLALMMVLALAACAGGTTATSPSPSEDASAPVESPSAEPEEPSPTDDWSYIKAKGEIVIGITDWEPMNYYDTDGKTLIGFDTEYAEAVFAKLGVTPEFIIIDWESKELELKSKNIDCIWNGLTVRDELRGSMTFTDSYIRNEQVLVVPAADASKYADKASLKGVSVVAEAGSAGESAVLSDLPDASYTAVDSQAKALLEVKAGTAAAAVIDATMAASMTGEGTDYADLAVITTLELTTEEYAVGFRLDSTAVAEVNRATKELLADGTLAGIAEKYGLSDRLITD